jgi:hypothetical protein
VGFGFDKCAAESLVRDKANCYWIRDGKFPQAAIGMFVAGTLDCTPTAIYCGLMPA